MTTDFVDAFDLWTHKIPFGDTTGRNPKELVGDGHMKVVSRLCSQTPTPKRAGKPMKGKKTKRMTNGWFVVCAPKTGTVVAASQMFDPENNAIASSTFEKALRNPGNKKVDCLYYYRMCSLENTLRPIKAFRKIKFFSCDRLHGEEART